jgi:hypothetical protein
MLILVAGEPSEPLQVDMYRCIPIVYFRVYYTKCVHCNTKAAAARFVMSRTLDVFIRVVFRQAYNHEVTRKGEIFLFSFQVF